VNYNRLQKKKKTVFAQILRHLSHLGLPRESEEITTTANIQPSSQPPVPTSSLQSLITPRPFKHDFKS
jgi:hypothetical protein